MSSNKSKVTSGNRGDTAGDKVRSSESSIGYRVAKLAKELRALELSLQRQITTIDQQLTSENYLYVDTYYEGDNANIFNSTQDAINKLKELNAGVGEARGGVIELINATDNETIEIDFTMTLVIIQANYSVIGSINIYPGTSGRLDISLVGRDNNQIRVDDFTINRPGGEGGDVYIRLENARITSFDDSDAGLLDSTVEAFNSRIDAFDGPNTILTIENTNFGLAGETLRVFGGSAIGGQLVALEFAQGAGLFPMTWTKIDYWDIVTLSHNSGSAASIDRVSLHSIMANNTTLTNVTFNVVDVPGYDRDYIETVATVGDLPADGYYAGRAIVVAATGTLYIWDDTRSAWINQVPIVITDPAVPTPSGTFEGQLGHYTDGANPPVLYMWDTSATAWVLV